MTPRHSAREVVLRRGIKLSARCRYRLVVTYDNPTGRTLPQAAMGILVGLFTPKDLEAWPAIDQASAGLALDVARLLRSGAHGHP